MRRCFSFCCALSVLPRIWLITLHLLRETSTPPSARAPSEPRRARSSPPCTGCCFLGPPKRVRYPPPPPLPRHVRSLSQPGDRPPGGATNSTAVEWDWFSAAGFCRAIICDYEKPAPPCSKLPNRSRIRAGMGGGLLPSPILCPAVVVVARFV